MFRPCLSWHRKWKGVFNIATSTAKQQQKFKGTFGGSSGRRQALTTPGQQTDAAKRNIKSTLYYITAGGVLVVGFSYAAVPLYSMFCQVKYESVMAIVGTIKPKLLYTSLQQRKSARLLSITIVTKNFPRKFIVHFFFCFQRLIATVEQHKLDMMPKRSNICRGIVIA